MRFYKVKDEFIDNFCGKYPVPAGGVILSHEELYRLAADWDEQPITVFSMVDFILDTTIRGNTYAKRQDCLRGIAIDWQYDIASCDLSYSELAWWNDYFRKNGKLYGLLREFKEAGIL